MKRGRRVFRECPVARSGAGPWMAAGFGRADIRWVASFVEFHAI